MRCNVTSSPEGVNVVIEGDTYSLNHKEAISFAVKLKATLNRMGTSYPACDINSGIFGITANPKEYTLLRSELLFMWYELKRNLKIK